MIIKDDKLIILQPGEFFWGDEEYRIVTVLGSCVSICLWHPVLKIGGISHSMLPGRRDKRRAGRLNPKYCDDVNWLISDFISQNKTNPIEYTVKVFGGSSMFNAELKGETRPSMMDIGNRNVEDSINRLFKSGFKISARDFGGTFHRKIKFSLSNGEVLLKKTNKSEIIIR